VEFKEFVWGGLPNDNFEGTIQKLVLVGRQVRCEGCCIEPAGEFTFFYRKRNENHELGSHPHRIIMSAVKRFEFVSDRMSCITLRGRWCHIIFLNVHAPTQDKIDNVKDSFYEELERVFDKFLNIMKILLGDFNAKVSREDIYKPTIGNESLHEISNDNGIGIVNFATSKNLTVKSTVLLEGAWLWCHFFLAFLFAARSFLFQWKCLFFLYDF
jgi:hypothetical protein